jgi:16S rRNA (cytosine967-C5)-methyltransferase
MPTEVLQSVPDWLYAYGQTQLGDRWDAELAGLNVLAPTYLRANRLKTDVEGLLDDLVSEGVTASLVPEAPDAVMLDAKLKVIRLGSFRKGLFEVQDASSQLIAPFLAPEPGQLVIDACAGAGGKALHLAALMENQGKIIAMDVEAFKLDELKRRAKRNGVKIIHTYPIEGRKTIKQFHDKADRLLLDVPCTGLGVLRRNPDTKWKLDEESIWDLQQTQASILNQYSKMVKTGGLMVYATCSLMPAEDEDQVQKFLGEHKNWEFVKDLHTWPSEGWDGFYMALLRRNK